KHLHIPRKHQQITALLLEDVQQLALAPRFVLRRDGQVMKRNVVSRGQPVEVAVIGDYGWYLHWQSTDAESIQEIVEAVVEPGHHDQQTLLDREVVDFPPHVERRRERTERIPD